MPDEIDNGEAEALKSRTWTAPALTRLDAEDAEVANLYGADGGYMVS